MSKQKCNHPDCKGKTKKFVNVGLHKRIVHEGQTIGAVSQHGTSRGESTYGGDGSFGGQISRAVNSRSGLLPAGFQGVKGNQQPSTPSTRGIFDEDGNPTQVLKGTGLRVVRKVGDVRRYD